MTETRNERISFAPDLLTLLPYGPRRRKASQKGRLEVWRASHTVLVNRMALQSRVHF